MKKTMKNESKGNRRRIEKEDTEKETEIRNKEEGNKRIQTREKNEEDYEK